MDLRDALQELAGHPDPPTQKLKDADLHRARRAARKRRNRRLVGGSIGAAVAVIAASVTTIPQLGITGPDGPPAAPPTITDERVRLLAYQGQQPEGFTFDLLPDGWFVQNSTAKYVVIAPERVRNPGPSVNPSKSPIYDPTMAVDKIFVTVEKRLEYEPKGDQIKVGARDGVLVRDERSPGTDGNAGTAIYVKQDGGYLITQFWAGLPFTERQMIEFAAGVHAG